MQTDWQDKEFVQWYNRELEFNKKQIKTYLKHLNLNKEDVLVDFGCGNGVLLEIAAPQVKSALGVDGSCEQIGESKERLKEFSNISLQNTNFIECRLEGYKFTKGSARKALHHLTDEEKPEFFKKISPHFEKGSLFVIEDAIFDFHKGDIESNKERIYKEAESFYGERWKEIEKAFKVMMAEEFPTDIFTWEKSLNQGGFKVIKHIKKTCFLGVLLAGKE